MKHSHPKNEYQSHSKQTKERHTHYNYNDRIFLSLKINGCTIEKKAIRSSIQQYMGQVLYSPHFIVEVSLAVELIIKNIVTANIRLQEPSSCLLPIQFCHSSSRSLGDSIVEFYLGYFGIKYQDIQCNQQTVFFC